MRTFSANSKPARHVAALFSIWMILVQALVGVPLAQRVMAPVEALPGGGLVLCTAAGRIEVGGDHHLPVDQAPSCPFCMPLCGGAATLAVAVPLPVPTQFEPLVRQPVLLSESVPTSPRRFVQPRAPPSLV